MSTILDALRKVEEENRTRNADARTRLLTTSQRFDLRPPRRQRVSWLVSTGLIVGGIALGAGLMGWGGSTRSTLDAVVHTGESVVARSSIPPPSQILTANPEHLIPAAYPGVPLAAAKEEPKVLVVSPPASIRFESGNQTEHLRLQQHQEERLAGGPSVEAAKLSPPSVTHAVPLPQNVAAVDISGTLPTPADRESPVQRSPFVNTVEPERIALMPLSPPIDYRGDTKAKPATKSIPVPPALAKTKVAIRPPVKSTPASLEERDVAEGTPSAPQEEDVVDETTSPPTPASVSFLQWSPEPEKRMAFIKVGDAPTTLAHEGDMVNGVRVLKIRQGTVELQLGGNRWTLKAR
jgi:hypothetical protein